MASLSVATKTQNLMIQFNVLLKEFIPDDVARKDAAKKVAKRYFELKELGY